MSCVSTDRFVCDLRTSATDGVVVWTPARSLWTGGMTAVALIGAPLTASADAALVFLLTSIVTLCAGHSVGLHRMLIHRAFTAPRWLEYLLVWLGTLVGMAGPFGMVRTHDLRDWAQRQTQCHDLHAHRAGFFRDAWWQMHCAVELRHPPRFELERRLARDRFYRFLERSWMWQQLPVALALYAVGGIGWAIWGGPLRVAVSLTGHWLVGHYAHRGARQSWAVDGVAVQGYDVPYVSLLTFGESWHGNHHAFPHSARLGVLPGQFDPGWWLIWTLERIGLARDVRRPVSAAARPGLRRLGRGALVPS